MIAADKVMGPILFILFIFFILFVVLNMLISIIIDAYENANEALRNDDQSHDLFRAVIHILQARFSKLKSRGFVLFQVEKLKEYTEPVFKWSYWGQKWNERKAVLEQSRIQSTKKNPAALDAVFRTSPLTVSKDEPDTSKETADGAISIQAPRPKASLRNGPNLALISAGARLALRHEKKKQEFEEKRAARQQDIDEMASKLKTLHDRMDWFNEASNVILELGDEMHDEQKLSGDASL